MKKILITSIIVSVCCSLIAWSMFTYQQKRIGVIDILRLVNEFEMKKELERANGKNIEQLGMHTDSLKNLLHVRSRDTNTSKEELQELYVHYMQNQQQFEKAYEQLSQEINEQVWKRLNPLLDDYGKQEKLRLIIGANGMGTVLYNDDYFDHTESVIKYVNTRYEKGN
jgi:outer membrane protein